MIDDAVALNEVFTTTQVAQQLGLSVTSVQKLVESGELEAWTTPGGHRRVSKSAVDKLLQSRAPLKSAALSGNMRVLLVEDDPNQVRLFEVILNRHGAGIDLIVCNDASSALIQMERTRPDLIVTDLMMQPFDGYHLLSMIERDQAFFPMDVVVMSGLCEDEARAKGHIPHWVAYYQKPINQDRLLGYLDSMRARVIKRALANR